MKAGLVSQGGLAPEGPDPIGTPGVRRQAVGPGQRRLPVFLKYPTPGRVKTRLAAEVGAEAAAAVYRACVEVTLERLAPLRAVITLCVDPPEAVAAAQAWLGDGWSIRPQRGATLGDRLAEATGAAFADGAQRVVVIGTDSPWLRASDVEAAFGALGHADAVVGPAADGGYYLIGLARPAPQLFTGIAWGSASVYEATLATARRLGLRVQALAVGYDLDTVEDVERFLEQERSSLCRSSQRISTTLETIVRGVKTQGKALRS